MKINDSAEGPGKYGDEATEIMKKTKARTVLLIVENGNKGSGFSVITRDHSVRFLIPTILRHMADEIEQGIATARNS